MMKEGLINIPVDGTVISIGADEHLTCAWSFDLCSHRMQEGEVRTESWSQKTHEGKGGRYVGKTIHGRLVENELTFQWTPMTLSLTMM